MSSPSRQTWDRFSALLLAAAFLVCSSLTQAHLALFVHHDFPLVAGSTSLVHDHGGVPDDDDHDDAADHDHDQHHEHHDQGGQRHTPHASGDHVTIAAPPSSSTVEFDALALVPAPVSMAPAALLAPEERIFVFPDEDVGTPPSPLLSLSRPRSPPTA